MKIILADAHGPVRGKAQMSPNLGLLYLASYLRERIEGLELRYVPQNWELREHIRLIEEMRPDLYAMSFTSYGARVAYASIAELKARFPDLPIVCGGPHPSSAPEDLLTRTAADLCVIGEGEETFTEIVRQGSGLMDNLASVRGIAYRAPDGSYRENAPRELIADLDSVPFPARDLVNEDDFTGSALRRGVPDTEMIITRGCPLRCVFCANPVFRVDGPLYRARSPESIAAEVEELYRMGYRELYLHSDELNVRLGWSIEVCKALAALGHDDLYFQANLRVVPMDEELARWLKRANFWMVRFGIESASERVLRGIKKRMAPGRTERTLRLMAEHNIKVFGFFMMFQIWQDKEGNLEFETVEEVNRSLRTIRDYWRKNLLHYMAWGEAVPVQGAEMYDVAVRHGIIDRSYYPDEPWRVHDRLPHVSKAEYARIVRHGRLLQGAMALRNGSINWSNWTGLMVKAKDLLVGAQTK
ncbi:MAG: radical SAM protein [Gemmatimonadetes bacterium]|nr:radical SAM protein [Gemmatimonadota bacterium]